MKRLATALVLIPVVTWLILGAPQWLFIAALAAIGLVAFYEYDQLTTGQGIARAGLPGMAAGIALLLAPAPGLVAVLVALLGMTLALRVRELKDAAATASVFSLGVLYIFGSWRCAIELRAIDPNWLMFAVLISWAGDTVALAVGRAWGRHKFAPRISPAKSWEGAIGSLAGGMLAGGVYAHYLLATMPLALALALAAAGNLAGQAGDLCESAIKRAAGAKDSGSSLPGHGGWLDRIDSSLFSVPVVYALLLIVKR